MTETEARRLLGTEWVIEHKTTQSNPDCFQMLFYAQGMADTLGKTVMVWRNLADNTLQCGDETPDPTTAKILSWILPH